MKVVIFSGGSGSQQLQRGLDFFNKDVDAMDITVITNCYDNGLSTGEVRKVFDGNILGPSDLRKNQILQYSLKEDHNKDLIFPTNLRIDEDNFEDAAQKIIDAHLQLADKVSDDIFDRLAWALNYFMAAPKAKDISYMNFSVSNAIYAAFANYHSNRMSEAGREMADILGLPKDSVVLNSDESLYLKAVTESGFVIGDEADIVDWNNEEDKIIDTFTENVKGEVVAPTLSDEAYDKIVEADLIILSSGTQWSSLIPTYKSKGFEEAIKKSSAKIIMIMNKSQDGDMKGRNAEYIVNVVSKYFEKEFDIIITNDVQADDAMKHVKNAFGNNVFLLKENDYHRVKHNHEILAKFIFDVYFREYDNWRSLILDYDDTIYPRDKSLLPYYEKIKEYLKNDEFYIVTGNDYHHVEKLPGAIAVYADNAINKFVDGKFEKSLIDISYEDIDDMIDWLIAYKYSPDMIKNRGNVSIAIKPITFDRDFIVNDVNMNIPMYGEFYAKPSGSSTVEIVHKNSSKMLAINDILENTSRGYIYIGDEPNGNDEEVFNTKSERFQLLPVRNINETLLFLKHRSGKI